ncbi:alpha/beta hydrolase [Ferrimonas aestuarii]|uniref:Alpha/beta hydrolase n=1 Tax=Ferrimonas aestuarii TaxID=2569539 RepID=A0A4U1BN12_9GAMM|nr:alpha/beta hydrolase-fold protein [Ferrimonas aestuarii]TKB54771.1 alpha/beta hydrolase [Ferrimonas aestuarii]
MKPLLLLLSLLSFSTLAITESAPIPLSIGEQWQFESTALGESRTINVYLPLSYHKGEKDYPVIYLLDGSMDEDFIHISGLVQFGSFSWVNQLPESIVIGIANVDRKRDFTYPSSDDIDRRELPTSGGSAAFIKMLAEELQPLIASKYRTRGQQTLIGQSLGGLLATEVLLTKPELFNHYVIISPSLWWDKRGLLSQPYKHAPQVKSVYVGVGKEGEVMTELARVLHRKLAQEPQRQFSIHFGYFEQLDHGDTLHLAVYDAFEKLFRPSL